MAKIKLTINEEHIKLIKEFRIERLNDIHVGFDTINPYGGSFLMVDLAMILGYWDKAIDGTEKDYDGRKFGVENETKMLNVHMYLMDNFEYILSLMIQYVSEGIKPGKYTAIDKNLKWKYEE